MVSAVSYFCSSVMFSSIFAEESYHGEDKGGCMVVVMFSNGGTMWENDPAKRYTKRCISYHTKIHRSTWRRQPHGALHGPLIKGTRTYMASIYDVKAYPVYLYLN